MDADLPGSAGVPPACGYAAEGRPRATHGTPSPDGDSAGKTCARDRPDPGWGRVSNPRRHVSLRAGRVPLHTGCVSLRAGCVPLHTGCVSLRAGCVTLRAGCVTLRTSCVTPAHELCVAAHRLCTAAHGLCFIAHRLCIAAHALCVAAHELCVIAHRLCIAARGLCNAAHRLCKAAHGQYSGESVPERGHLQIEITPTSPEATRTVAGGPGEASDHRNMHAFGVRPRMGSRIKYRAA